ncbi:MAG: branched-chain amino acid transport system II carrier protein [Simkaniaceae bacterium]|nr:branched-chain amino acid transport system II carrier protein [Simkaniaceae bacterium]
MAKVKTQSLATGMAMFSMFFGAGNITFPLIIGQVVHGNLIFALLGLILTAVFIPFAGLMAITLFEGDYTSFFSRIGKIPGYAIILILLALIGPFGGIPRCITLTFSTLSVYFSSLELFSFSLLSCVLVFLCCWKKNRILDLIGYVLTPFLLLFLLIIIVKGIFFAPEKALVVATTSNKFLYGLKEGYNTMDLLASFFFSSLIYQKLKSQIKDTSQAKAIVRPIFKACIIGASLLSSVYIGFSYVAANYSAALEGVPTGKLLGTLGHLVLGPQAGIVVSMSIALTCLTTIIALTVICSEFLQKQIFREKVRYEVCLGLILIASLCFSSLEFSGIVTLLSPVLQVIYPALLGLSLFNILHKLFNFKLVKTPVYAIFMIVLLSLIFKG